MISKLKKILRSKKALGSLTTAIKVGTAAVLGASLLVGGAVLTKDVVLPKTENGVNNVASYKGGQLNGEKLTIQPSLQDKFNELSQDIITRPSSFYYGDYKYTFYSSGWDVKLNDSYSGTDKTTTLGIEVVKTDRSQKSYGEILESAFGYPVVRMSYTFKDCSALEIAPQIPSGVTNMEYAFSGCTSLTDLSDFVIPNGVNDIGSSFEKCTSLTAAPEIPNGVINMASTFTDCTSLATVPIIPSSVNYMDYTFKGCTALTDLSGFIIPNSVRSMEETFRNCTSLTTAPIIPNTSFLKNMKFTFQDCTSLSGTITINANPTDYSGCFKNCGNINHPITLTGSSTTLAKLKSTAGSGHTSYITVV